jgi:xanthine/uracil permease
MNTLLKLSPSKHRRRPPELTYSADQMVPKGALLVLGGQHAVTVLAFVSYVLVAAKEAGVAASAMQSMVAVALLGMAACTFLQAWGGRWGSGSLLAHMPNPFMVPFVVLAVAAGGPPAVFGVTLLSALTALAVGAVMPRLRALFPPTVGGTVVCMGGLALVEPTVRHSLELDAVSRIDASSALIFTATLVCIVGFSVWGTRHSKLLGLLIGMLIGVLVAAASGHLHGLDAVMQAPLWAVPELHAPVWVLQPTTAVAVVLVAALTQLDTLGSVIIMDKMDDADWHRADMKAIGKGMRANGLGDLLGAVLGSFPTFTSSANIALTHATRATARRIGVVAAAMLAAVAFMPQVTLALTLIPPPVLGAVELYAAAFLMVSGVELIASRAMDSRGIFMVGLSLAAGMAVMVLPGLAQHAPGPLQALLGNGFIVTGVTAVGLNALFRLGIRQRCELTLAPGAVSANQQITDFVELRGAAWAARRDVVARAAHAALEAYEAIHTEEGRQVSGLRLHFDEFRLDVDVLHSGPPLLLQAVDPHAAIEGHAFWNDDPQALDQLMQQVSARLLLRLADRVTAVAGSANQSARLRLHFQH